MGKSLSVKKDWDDRLGKKIKDAMSILGVSVRALSETTGIEPQTLYSILNGHHQPSLIKLESICNALKVSVDALLDLEVNTLSLFPRDDQESLSYARFEDIWFGPEGGERISISRSFSMANYSEALRESMLRHIERAGEEQVTLAMEAFRARQEVIRKKEKRRIEVVTDAEVSDFICQRPPYDQVQRDLIVECVEGIIRRIKENPLDYELVIIPGLHHRVNYEIINREVILFNLGTIFLRQTHKSILDHFLREVGRFKTDLAIHANGEEVAAYLKKLLESRDIKGRGAKQPIPDGH